MATEKTRIGKQAFIDEVATNANEVIAITKKDTDTMVNVTLNTIGEILQRGDDLIIPGFGSFKVQDVKARKGRNIQTGEIIKIPAHKKVKFSAGKDLNEKITTKPKKTKKK